MNTKWKIKVSDFENGLYQKDVKRMTKECENSGYHIDIVGEYLKVVKDKEPSKSELSNAVRARRDAYLFEYVDPIVCNPFRWSEMTEEEQNEIKEYRQYLLDIPEQSEFPNIEVKTFNEWRS